MQVPQPFLIQQAPSQLGVLHRNSESEGGFFLEGHPLYSLGDFFGEGGHGGPVRFGHAASFASALIAGAGAMGVTGDVGCAVACRKCRLQYFWVGHTTKLHRLPALVMA